jgi:uncharacterized protein YndB with AHSA1/START domain
MCFLESAGMHIRERTVINRPALAVWPYIVTPERFQAWNEKVSSMEARGRFQAGQRFVTRYTWKDKQIQCQSVAVRLEEGRVLELRHASPIGRGLNRDLEVVERVTLEDRGACSVVTKDVYIKNHDLPWFLVPVAWFLTRIGKPVGKDRLKAMCEGESA